MPIRSYAFDYTSYSEQLQEIFHAMFKLDKVDWDSYRKILHKHPKTKGQLFTKNQLILGLRGLLADNVLAPEYEVLNQYLQMKPIRTQSGIASVTVLTKPFPCPGRCIFCPNDVRMPKSYLRDEPGAQRAERNNFDPYLQTYRRLQAYQSIGHPTDKIELIILGGTWSFYPEGYQIWFIQRCFQALNDFGEGLDETNWYEEQSSSLDYSKLKASRVLPEHLNPASTSSESKLNLETLETGKGVLESVVSDLENHQLNYNRTIQALAKQSNMLLKNPLEVASWLDLELEQKRNELAECRCVGLVVETRPDNISEAEVIRIRRLGCTKTQIGLQSLTDEVLEKNHRGHDVQASRRAIKLLRQAGFKIHGHWMSNLYGSSPEADLEDYKKLFTDPDFCPDELKIYPCSLIDSAELMDYYADGRWQPYSFEELLLVVTGCIESTPEYCRLTRIIRDIPGTDIVTGNKITNFRQLAEEALDKKGVVRLDIRSREIKNQKVQREDLELKIITYQTSVGLEKFLQFVTKENQIVGFLRLSLPIPNEQHFISELQDAAIIREIHVYGQVVGLSNYKHEGKAQHLGLGKELISQAKSLASEAKFDKLVVISAIGTREYYRKQGFQDGELYQWTLTSSKFSDYNG